MARTRLPIGFLFPTLTMVVFSYEILFFYFWSVARRYQDLIDVMGENGELLGQDEDANQLLAKAGQRNMAAKMKLKSE
jgi:F420-0:gamma-glutamyl ligase-like protein